MKFRERVRRLMRRDLADRHEASVEPPRGHLGEWADVDVANIDGIAGAVSRIYDGTLDGLTIRNVFDPSEMAAAVERIREHSAEFIDHGEQIMFGTALVGADGNRQAYLDDVHTMHDGIPGIFGSDFMSRVSEIISVAADGAPVTVPTEPDGRPYTPATIRLLPPDRGVMHAHTANEFCNVWDAYNHLRDIARMWNSLSYFVLVQAPDAGGDLVVYDLMWDDTPDEIQQLSMSQERDVLLEAFDPVPRSLGAGDMVLFTGGRIWHRVTPVTGSTERVTVGGFAATASDADGVYIWS